MFIRCTYRKTAGLSVKLEAVRWSRQLLRGTLLILVVMLAQLHAHGQAWTLPRGASYVKISYGHVTAAEQFTFDGRSTDYINGLPGDTFKDRSLYLYSEIGLSDHFSLVLSVPYKRTFVRDHAFRFRIFGLGNVMIGGRFSLLPLLNMNAGRQALSINTLAYIPTGYTRNFTPSTGAGQIDFQASLYYGLSLYPAPAYLQAGLGYRHRSSIYSFSQSVPCISGSDIHCITDPNTSYGDELQFHAELGLSPFNGLVLIQAITTGAWSTQKPEVGFSAVNPLPTHQRLIKMGAGLTLYPFRLLKSTAFDSLGFSAQYYTTPLGRNTINSRDLFVGLELRPRFSKTTSISQ